ncbi:hypothetical protein, partial [Marivirga sp.]|uniref:hypothetical protein n=1 Tax=Marivirga sp. TaxID=2018662 RepID=UPI0025F5FB2A
NLSSTLICKFRFSYNSIDKTSFRRYSGLYRGKTTQYIGLYGKAFPIPPVNSDFLPKNSLQ